MKWNKKGQETIGIIICAFIAIIFIGGFVCLIGFDTVDASHVGVKNRFGVLQGTMMPGMAWTGLFVHVEQYDLRMRKIVVDMVGNAGSVDKDGQSVYSTIEVNYRLSPHNIEDAYAKIGQDAHLANILNIEGTIKEGFKSITSEYTSLEIFQKRSEVKEKAIIKMRENFPADYFILENVIISNIDFNPAFKAAIEAKKVAEETAKAVEKQVDIAKFEADKIIEAARGSAKSKELSADAIAYEKRAIAGAKAYEVLEIAKAEAEALKLKKAQLSDAMLTKEWIDAWKAGGSQVPKWITDGAGQQFLVEVME